MLTMAALRVPEPKPVPTSSLANRRSIHMPLSSHGMPKAPRALSPERPHRFSTIVLPSPPAEPSPMTPLSPGPISPPMSAKSFGTFIDSAPSTPAYSPRQEGGEWSDSQITILRPMSSSSLPSSPTEPAWEMMTPLKQPAKAFHAKEGRTIATPRPLAVTATPLALSKPTKRTKMVIATNATTDVPKVANMSSEEDALRREAEAQARKLVEEEEIAAKSQDALDQSQTLLSPQTDTAPLGKLATRMKLLLRRNTSEKKKGKKSKPQQEYDHLDDAHWSEM